MDKSTQNSATNQKIDVAYRPKTIGIYLHSKSPWDQSDVAWIFTNNGLNQKQKYHLNIKTKTS